MLWSAIWKFKKNHKLQCNGLTSNINSAELTINCTLLNQSDLLIFFRHLIKYKKEQGKRSYLANVGLNVGSFLTRIYCNIPLHFTLSHKSIHPFPILPFNHVTSTIMVTITFHLRAQIIRRAYRNCISILLIVINVANLCVVGFFLIFVKSVGFLYGGCLNEWKYQRYNFSNIILCLIYSNRWHYIESTMDSQITTSVTFWYKVWYSLFEGSGPVEMHSLIFISFLRWRFWYN